MGAEWVAIGSLGVSIIGSVWKLYRHIDRRLDQTEVDREGLKAELRLLGYRITRIEENQKR